MLEFTMNMFINLKKFFANILNPKYNNIYKEKLFRMMILIYFKD